MLRDLVVFTMQGRWQSAIIIATMSLLALMLPPVSYLASGIIALCTLRAGPKEGITVLLIATSVFALAAMLLMNQPLLAGVFLMSNWLPVYGISLMLGYTRSLSMSLLVTTGIGILLVVGTYIVLPSPAEWWLQMMMPMVEMLEAQPGWKLSQTETQSFVSALSRVMTGLLVAGLFANIVLGLLLGRAWQAELYSPESFAKEFQQLRLGKVAATVMAVTTVTALLASSSVPLLQDFIPILIVLFVVQGLAVTHAIVRLQQRHKAWLIVMYILLLIMTSQMAVLLALIGVLEQWFNFRQGSLEQDE